MKRYNKFLNILNIIIFVEIIIMNLSLDIAATFFMIYRKVGVIHLAFCYIGVILNILNAIVYLKDGGKKNVVLQLTIGFIISISFLINHRIFPLMLGVIGLIFSIIALVTSEKSNVNKNIYTILFIALLGFQIMIFLIPIIMNMSNLNNLKKALPIIESQITIKTNVEKEDDEYVFYLKKGNELNRVQFEEMYVNQENKNNVLCAIELNGNRLEIGVAKEKNKVIIINSQGEEILYLYNMFENYYDIAEHFFNYIGKTHKYGMLIN